MEWLKDQMRKVLDRISGIEYSFTQPIEMRTSEMLTGSRGDVVVKIFGEEIDTLNALGSKIKQIVEKTEGSQDVYMRQNEGVAYYERFVSTKKNLAITGWIRAMWPTCSKRLSAVWMPG